MKLFFFLLCSLLVLHRSLSFIPVPSRFGYQRVSNLQSNKVKSSQFTGLFSTAVNPEVSELVGTNKIIAGDPSLSIAPNPDNSLISNFFKGKNVLVTGGTGFIGGVLVQTLIEKIPGIGKIYCLCHSKEGMVHEKISWIKGDIRQENFGLSAETVADLQENVEIIFHLGAYTGWDLGLKDQVEMNCDGVLNMAEFALKCKNIKQTLFTSSYWSLLNHKSTQTYGETFYQDYNGEVEYDQIKQGSDSRLNEWPNAYSYAKNLAERLLHQRYPQLPVTIARVTSACGAWKFPSPGYCRYDNAFPAFIRAVALDGVVNFPEAMKNAVNDCIPVDIAINMMLANIVENQSGGQNVVHLSSANRNLPTLGEMVEYTAPINYFKTKEELSAKLSELDIKTAIKSNVILSAYQIGIEEKHIFLDYNSRRPLKWMNEDDHKLFPIDVDQVNWRELVTNMVINIKDSVPLKRKKNKST